MTFNADRYRPQAVKQLEAALGSPVRIGHLALGWKNGIVLEVKEAAIYRDKQSLDKPAVYLESASAKVRLAPLLQKKLEVTSITLVRPRFNVIKEADGAIRVNGINTPPSSGQIPASPKTAPVVLSDFAISTIRIEDAGVGFVDNSSAPPMRLAIRHLDILIKNLSLKIDSSRITELDADFDLKVGKIAVESLRSALDHADLSAHFAENQMQLKNFTANFARGKISGSGSSKDYLSASSQSAVALEIDRIYLEDLLPSSRPSRPELHGIFSASFNGNARGISWPAISRTLNGSGKVALASGVIVNGNILRKVFENLSRIPGVTDAINTRLPENYHRNLAQRDTAIPSIEFPVTIADGIVTIPNLRIFFEGFTMYGAGQIGLSGAINCQVTLVLDAELSQVLIQSVPTMQYIADPQGNLAFPVKISGTTQNLLVLPDTDYIFSRVMATKGQELITNVLQKALSKGQEAGQSGTAAGGGDASYQQILGSLLQ